MECPVINAINPSNEQQKKNAIEIIESKGKRKVGVLGFRLIGTDDLRCSPIVDVAEVLLGKGYEIHIYDKNVRVSQLTGTNADFIAAKLPHLHEIITDDLEAVCSECDVLVITNKEKEFTEIPEKYPNKVIVDLVRQFDELDYEGNYEGISWANINVNIAQNNKLIHDIVNTEF